MKCLLNMAKYTWSWFHVSEAPENVEKYTYEVLGTVKHGWFHLPVIMISSIK